MRIEAPKVFVGVRLANNVKENLAKANEGPNAVSNIPEDVPDVTVIIPAYNSEGCIGQCVESVLASRFPAGKMEVICIDNNSSDGTLGVLQSFGSAIKLLREPKRGAGAARNAGLHKALGTFVAFTDADCTVASDWLANILAPLRSDQACAVGGRILSRPEAGPVERFGELIHDHQHAIEVVKPPYVISMNMASRLDLLLSLGGFDERWLRMQDGDLSLRLVRAGRRLRYCHNAVIYHHNRDTIRTLMWEGFTHGYWTSAFSKVYGDFERACERRAWREENPAAPILWPYYVTPLAPKTAKSPDPRLSRWQIALYWKLFRAAKEMGIRKGRRRPPIVVE